MTDPREPLDPEAVQEAIRQLKEEEHRREAEKIGDAHFVAVDAAELLLRAGAESIDAVGNVVGTVAKVGVEAVGQILGGALDGL